MFIERLTSFWNWLKSDERTAKLSTAVSAGVASVLIKAGIAYMMPSGGSNLASSNISLIADVSFGVLIVYAGNMLIKIYNSMPQYSNFNWQVINAEPVVLEHTIPGLGNSSAAG